MAEFNPNALSLEEPTIESQPISQAQAELDPQPASEEADPDFEPSAVIEHNGRRYVAQDRVNTVVAATRRGTREATERTVREREVTPLQAKAQEADQLRAALNEARPYIDLIRQRPELLQPPKPTPLEQQISDEDAAAEARDLELFDAKTGQPDLGRARRIIARRRQDTQSAAQQAAQAAVGPITSQTAQSASRNNFASLAMRRDAQNQPLVDPKALAEMWVSLPPELTQHPEVGELILDAAIGKSIRTTGRVQRPERSPIVSEPAGGRTGPQWQMDSMARSLAKNAGISEKDFQAGAKTYQPGQTNILGE